MPCNMFVFKVAAFGNLQKNSNPKTRNVESSHVTYPTNPKTPYTNIAVPPEYLPLDDQT